MDIANPHFAEPAWLGLAVAGPLLLLALHAYAARARRRQLAQVASPASLAALTASVSGTRRRVKQALLVLAVAAIGLTLARPQWGEHALTTQPPTEDVLILLDCSRSMLADDLRPTRLERAKLAIQEFLASHSNGRVGLVVFAGQAFLQCPLTYDHDAFRETLWAVDDKSIPVAGTDVGRALDEAFLATENPEGRKVMLLVSDGEDLEEAGLRMAEALRDRGVVVFAAGVGTPRGSRIPVLSSNGVPDFLRDERGQPVWSRLNEEILRKIASLTGGSYEPIGARGEGLVRLRLNLESSQAARLRARQSLGVERFHWPLALATACLVAESLLGTRRTRGEVLPVKS
jgi:Ca-activated chloride channel family protein